jgi:hypothetical protein
MPRFRAAFRVTHRFGRPLGRGSFGELAADLFGLDSGALVGLELRFGLARGTHVTFYRTSDRTIQLSGHQSMLRQDERNPLAVALVASIEGANNMRRDYAPGLGIVLSREIGDWAALYLVPLYVWNANNFSAEPGEDDGSFILGAARAFASAPPSTW